MAVDERVQQLAEKMRAGLGAKRLTDFPIPQMREIVENILEPSTIAVHHVADQTVPGPGGQIPVRIYRPNQRTDLPVLLWFHGGGFVLGSLNTGDDLCRRLCTAAEVVVVNVDYRLAPEHPFPAGLDDCLTAYQWVIDGGLPDCDNTRVALAGDSAGGALAMALSLRCRDDGVRLPQAQVSIYGSADLGVSNPEFGDLPFLSNDDVAWYWDKYLPTADLADHPHALPGRATDLSGLPPLLCVSPEHDPTRDDAENYAHRLQKAGGIAEVRRYPLMYHGFFGRPEMFETAAEAHRDVAAFLQRHLKAS